MSNQYNPFRENRAEQMRELWKYYVPFPGLDGAGKPIVVQGGRGSGKTMFFQCNSWRETLSKLRKNGQPSSTLLDANGFIGIYYRVDTTFVSSMQEREEEHWPAIFETYFSICILQEIIDLIIQLKRDMPLDENELSSFVSDYSLRLHPSYPAGSINGFRQDTDRCLDLIEDKINGLYKGESNVLRWVNAHRFISDLCKSFNILFDRDLLFKVFIDEYETLQEYQQKIINTLIKHSTLPVIFNIGLRPKGMKTPETISKTETIESPHDYELINLGIDSSEYPNIIREICKKRIALGKERGSIPPSAEENIEYYLGSYSIEYELQRIEQTEAKLPHISKLESKIKELGIEEGLDSALVDHYCDTLCFKAPIMNSRMHYALLCKKTQYTPTLEELFTAYCNKNSRYNDWVHNRKHGVVFLLCKEAKREKMYFGFDAFIALSSNNVRYFLELCEQTFKIAFLNDYNWENPISPEFQTEAARYVSEYKIVDIARYEPYGRELRLFVQYLGQIFYKLHTAEDNTLGEPEPNHFNTKDLSLPEQTKNLLDSAIMCNVLVEGEPTKRKQSILSPETVDYYLNKIYVPYFGISYRNQRKIQIEVEVLKLLLSGNERLVRTGFRNFFNMKPDQPIIIDNPSLQLSIFDNAHEETRCD